MPPSGHEGNKLPCPSDNHAETEGGEGPARLRGERTVRAGNPHLEGIRQKKCLQRPSWSSRAERDAGLGAVRLEHAALIKNVALALAVYSAVRASAAY